MEIRGWLEFRQVQLNSYGAGSYEDFVWKDTRLLMAHALAWQWIMNCGWRHFQDTCLRAQMIHIQWFVMMLTTAGRFNDLLK